MKKTDLIPFFLCCFLYNTFSIHSTTNERLPKHLAQTTSYNNKTAKKVNELRYLDLIDTKDLTNQWLTQYAFFTKDSLHSYVNSNQQCEESNKKEVKRKLKENINTNFTIRDRSVNFIPLPKDKPSISSKKHSDNTDTRQDSHKVPPTITLTYHKLGGNIKSIRHVFYNKFREERLSYCILLWRCLFKIPNEKPLKIFNETKKKEKELKNRGEKLAFLGVENGDWISIDGYDYGSGFALGKNWRKYGTSWDSLSEWEINSNNSEAFFSLKPKCNDIEETLANIELKSLHFISKVLGVWLREHENYDIYSNPYIYHISKQYTAKDMAGDIAHYCNISPSLYTKSYKESPLYTIYQYIMSIDIHNASCDSIAKRDKQRTKSSCLRLRLNNRSIPIHTGDDFLKITTFNAHRSIGIKMIKFSGNFTLGRGLLFNWKNLKTVSFSNEVKSIKENAFGECRCLKTIKGPKHIINTIKNDFKGPYLYRIKFILNPL